MCCDYVFRQLFITAANCTLEMNRALTHDKKSRAKTRFNWVWKVAVIKWPCFQLLPARVYRLIRHLPNYSAVICLKGFWKWIPGEHTSIPPPPPPPPAASVSPPAFQGRRKSHVHQRLAQPRPMTAAHDRRITYGRAPPDAHITTSLPSHYHW